MGAASDDFPLLKDVDIVTHYESFPKATESSCCSLKRTLRLGLSTAVGCSRRDEPLRTPWSPRHVKSDLKSSAISSPDFRLRSGAEGSECGNSGKSCD